MKCVVQLTIFSAAVCKVLSHGQLQASTVNMPQEFCLSVYLSLTLSSPTKRLNISDVLSANPVPADLRGFVVLASSCTYRLDTLTELRGLLPWPEGILFLFADMINENSGVSDVYICRQTSSQTGMLHHRPILVNQLNVKHHRQIQGGACGPTHPLSTRHASRIEC